MKAFGLFGARIPKRDGGLSPGRSHICARLIEELAYGWMSLAGVLNTHTIAASLVCRFGTLEQKARWLPTMATGATGRHSHCPNPTQVRTLQAITCRADLDGGEYVINGTKMWVTNGERSSLVAVAARTAEGITCLSWKRSQANRSRGSG